MDQGAMRPNAAMRRFRLGSFFWKSICCWLFCGTFAFSDSPLPQDGSKKVAAPDAAAQKDAEKLVREIFKDDYAKRQPADRVSLARKLMAQATETRDDAVTRF